MNFCLLHEDENGKLECCFEKLIGDYCVVNYYTEGMEEYAIDKLMEVLPVVTFIGAGGYYAEIDMWEKVNFIETFKDIEIASYYNDLRSWLSIRYIFMACGFCHKVL